MLIGVAETTIDDKGRLPLSKTWHSELASGFFVTRGFDQCLFIFPETRFESIMRDLSKQPIASSDVRTFVRHLTVFAERGDFDKQGRIFIPSYLRHYANVDTQVTVLGVIDRLEVWESKIFAEINAQSETNVTQVAEKYSHMIHPIA
jgi:MraZ protein